MLRGLCTRCGYFEEYAQQANQQDWDGLVKSGDMQWMPPPQQA